RRSLVGNRHRRGGQIEHVFRNQCVDVLREIGVATPASGKAVPIDYAIGGKRFVVLASRFFPNKIAQTNETNPTIYFILRLDHAVAKTKCGLGELNRKRRDFFARSGFEKSWTVL